MRVRSGGTVTLRARATDPCGDSSGRAVLYRWENTAVASERSSVGAETALLYPVDHEDGGRRLDEAAAATNASAAPPGAPPALPPSAPLASLLSFDGAIDGAAGGGALTLAGSNLVRGAWYSIVVTACWADAPDVCESAATEVALAERVCARRFRAAIARLDRSSLSL